jgi:spore maturation protein CgeB
MTPSVSGRRPLSIVVIGLSLSSSWGNGHATTYRSLLAGLAARGHDVLFLERDMPWYASNRDLANPSFCRLEFYSSPEQLGASFARAIATADAVIVGSYVPDGVSVLRLVLRRARGVVAFYDIDTPVTLAKLCRGEKDYLAPELIPAFDLYLSFTGGPTLERLEREFGARRALPCYCSVDDTHYRPTGVQADVDLGFLGTYSPDRQSALEHLLIEPARHLPDRRFMVVGPQFPPGIDWPANVECIDHLGPDEHPAFYGRLRFALNVTRGAMVKAGWSPSVRLFEAAACGTPIISDAWPGLTSLFPAGKAVVVAQSADDVVAALRNLPEDRRRSIGAAAHRIVLDAHTGRARAAELETAIREAQLATIRRRAVRLSLAETSA